MLSATMAVPDRFPLSNMYMARSSKEPSRSSKKTVQNQRAAKMAVGSGGWETVTACEIKWLCTPAAIELLRPAQEKITVHLGNAR